MDEDDKLIAKAIDILGEHFDTVQIFVTRHESGTDDGGTMQLVSGVGNWFARFGQVLRWANEERLIIRAD